MTQVELKSIVAAYLADGIPLSDIQTLLETDHDYKIKFFDLKMLASELEDVNWEKFTPKKPEPQDVSKPAVPQVGDGQTHVTVSKLARPGMMSSGNVIFASGATADWYVDNSGRPGIENVVGEPTEADVKGFMTELQKVFGAN